AGFHDLLGNGGGFRLVHFGDDDACASLGKGLGEHASDALPGAGDDDNAVLERGKDDAVEIGAHAALPDRTCCSSAARASHGVHHGFSPRSCATMPAVM